MLGSLLQSPFREGVYQSGICSKMDAKLCTGERFRVLALKALASIGKGLGCRPCIYVMHIDEATAAQIIGLLLGQLFVY